MTRPLREPDEVFAEALRIARRSAADRPRHPWRDVMAAEMEEGTSNVLNAAQSRTGRSWWLRLACGHETYRPVRYTPQARRARQRRHDDHLPAPKRVRCQQCGRSAAKADA